MAAFRCRPRGVGVPELGRFHHRQFVITASGVAADSTCASACSSASRGSPCPSSSSSRRSRGSATATLPRPLPPDRRRSQIESQIAPVPPLTPPASSSRSTARPFPSMVSSSTLVCRAVYSVWPTREPGSWRMHMVWAVDSQQIMHPTRPSMNESPP